MKRGISIDEHMNSYTKLLTDLINMNVKIDKEDKTVILLNSLPEEEYETFTLTLINGSQSLNYNEVSAALVNYEVKKAGHIVFFREHNSRGVGRKRQEFQSEGQR